MAVVGFVGLATVAQAQMAPLYNPYGQMMRDHMNNRM